MLINKITGRLPFSLLHLQQRDKNIVSTKEYIRRLLAGFTLLVFAVSITPTIAFHNWFASHSDSQGTKQSHINGLKYSKAGFNCKCDNTVAESPFTPPANFALAAMFRPFSIQQKITGPSIYPVHQFSFTLRGPPVQS